MSESKDTICFSCGQVVGDPPRLNRLESGDACPTCRERVLDALPPVLPRLVLPTAAEEAEVDPVLGQLPEGDDLYLEG